MTIGAYAFANSNSSYTEFTVNDNVREVKQGAFNNSKIHNIVIEEGVKAIYENAFYSRNNVAEGQILEIPATIDYIGTKAFYGYKASEIDVNEFNVKYADIDGELLTFEVKEYEEECDYEYSEKYYIKYHATLEDLMKSMR